MSEDTAAVSIRRFVNLLKGLAELEPELTSLASIKQAAGEAVNRTALARAQEGEANKALATALEQVDDAKHTAQELAAEATYNYDNEIARAKAEARKILDKAKADADGAHYKAQQKIIALQKETEQAETILKALNVEVEAAQRNYKETQEKLDALVASLGRR
jgi:predicted  nucleic acid-binding Zn-ribbon protein